MMQQRPFIAITTFPETDIFIDNFFLDFLKYEQLFNALQSVRIDKVVHAPLRSTREKTPVHKHRCYGA